VTRGFQSDPGPGNVRELRNAMGRVAILVPEEEVPEECSSGIAGACPGRRGSSVWKEATFTRS